MPIRTNKFRSSFSVQTQITGACCIKYLWHPKSQSVIPKAAWLLFFCITISAHQSANAQPSVNTLSTVRQGKRFQSFQKEDRQLSFYSDVHAEYQADYLLFGARAQGFNAPGLRDLGAPLQERYAHFSQLYAEVRWDWGKARIGNYYEIFGKGILLRGFELPGFIYEGLISRNQKRIIQDFSGQLLVLQPGAWTIKLLNAKPVDPLQQPDNRIVERYVGRLSGVEVDVALPAGVSLGGAYLEHRNEVADPFDVSLSIKRQAAYATRFMQWNAWDVLKKTGIENASAEFYMEYATRQGADQFGNLGADVPHGFYSSGNFTYGKLGLSLEYKDYNDFNLIFNDPPPGIRESSEFLLNRATHTLEAESETGYQIEAFYAPGRQTRIVANYSLARNFFDFGIRQLFQERYLAFEFRGNLWSSQFFIDSGQDTQVGELERITGGMLTSYHLERGTTLALDLQMQGIQPEFGRYFRNQYLSLKVQDIRSFSFAFSIERTQDPDVLNEAEKSADYLLSATVGWQPSFRHNLQLFAGKRRSGTYCDHGFCVEVLDFEGIELRMETRL